MVSMAGSSASSRPACPGAERTVPTPPIAALSRGQPGQAAGGADDDSDAFDWNAAPPPAPLDALLGRDSEVDVLRDALADGGQRLVALVGLGGVGKTRVAQEVAVELHAAGKVPVLWTSP